MPYKPRPNSTSPLLLIGFDSAWTGEKRGAIIGVVRTDGGTYRELDLPRAVNFNEAADSIFEWQNLERPTKAIILIDQPTIVSNVRGQRPVENLVASPVSLRYGGMQPANTSRKDMFGIEAPVWQFLKHFGGAANIPNPMTDVQVFETYPVLSLIALDWILPDRVGGRATGRLPKYNPARRKTFSINDWGYVCDQLSCEFQTFGLSTLDSWIRKVKARSLPKKTDQDCLDACICLVVALYLAERKDCLVVGDVNTGYIVVPYRESLYSELAKRCEKTQRDPSDWIRSFKLSTSI